ncbi:putative ubiquitinyl hydrolase 1 [Helianthus annuus]|nr:putative ubiquitinyl hydrolase 1 [Helianthus annuus]KAJ0821022.1 putative ubiquitinyl hydrolase 1 [Helianthus annuus]KAJ0835639.1 putative ubiquitinyl hydrolase 1 [Helianthus annuus]
MKHHHHQPSSEAVSSSSSPAEAAVSSSSQPPPPPPPSLQLMNATTPATDDHPTPPYSRDCSSSSSSSTSSSSSLESVTIERRGEYAAVCRWTIFNFPRVKTRILWSKYFEVGGYDCRLLVYPKGDSQALPGYISIYLQIMDPRGTSSSKWDCFASYRLTVVNLTDDSKSIHRDSWHRFSTKKKSHGWCDFTPSAAILDAKSGFLVSDDCCVVITADILILNESVNFVRDNIELQSSSVSTSVPVGDVLSGKFTWKVHNFSLFREMIKTQKIMSPVFPAGECNLRISIYQSSVNGVDYLSMCLESKDTEKASVSDRSCWCLFRMSVLNQKPGMNHIHRDSYGRFAADNKSGDNTSLGWNDYMKMMDFSGADSGFLVDDTAVFSTSFHVIKEHCSFSKNGGLIGGRVVSGARKSDGHMGKFTWKIENFTRLKDLLKKRKITGLCIKSRRFQIGNRDCRLIVYPRGQSQPPCHLSVFLEVTDSRNTTSDWSCFVNHRLSVVNQKMEDKSVTKESQNRYSKSAKDWGWREFVTLTSLFDQDSGFLVHDVVVFSAEVLIMKETSIMHEFTDRESESGNTGLVTDKLGKMSSFTWKVENFLSFKDIMETRKIFSRFFQAGGCELRLGVYESFDTICIYLESDQSVGTDPDKNFWVKYRMAVLNQKNPSKTVWKESSICTKTWNNSVLQFMKVSDMLEADAGFLVRDTIVFVCEILDCCPWFEFADLEVYASEDDQDALTTDPDELIDSEDSEGNSGDEEDLFRNLLSRAGFHLSYGDNPSQPQVTLREKLLMDAGAIAGFLTGLRVYLDDPAKVKRLLLPTKLSGTNDGKKIAKTNESSPSLMNLLMGVKVLQQAIIDLLLDIMVECCQPSTSEDDSSDRPSPDDNCSPEPSHLHVNDRLDSGTDDISTASAVQSSDMNGNHASEKSYTSSPPETSAAATSSESSSLRSKAKWPEQSEELLGLIVNSLRALDGAVPQGCPEPRRRPHSAQKIALVLDKAPKHLQPDLISLVPKLVEHSEHPLAASALLDRLEKADAEPDLLLPALGALIQLKCNSEVWERVLFQSFQLLEDLNDAALAATADFIFKAALHCKHLPEAVRSVRTRLKHLGDEVSACVLDYLSRTVASCTDVAEAILKDIENDDDYVEIGPSMPCGIYLFGENGTDDQTFAAPTANFSDIYMLLDMLSIPCLAAEASQTFEKIVSQGGILAASVAMVLERRLARRLNITSKFVAENHQHEQVAVEGETIEQLRVQRDDFTSVLGLVETLGLSRDPGVIGFVKMLYAILFKWYADGPYRLRILKRLVDRATSTTDTSREVDLDLEILVFLVSEEQEFVRPVLSMMQEVADLANVDRAALWHQLCASEDEVIRIREETKAEVCSMAKEKAVLVQKLSDAEATNSRLKIDMKAEMDRFALERKEMSEQMQELESQLEWLRSERDDEIAKLTTEKKIFQERLHDAEAQLSQLKSRKRDELKRITKEKNALAERLRNAEAARKRFDDELKRYATENVSREEVRQSLEDEVRRLTQTVGQTEGEKREKEEQIARCEAYIDGMESKLQTCEQYIHSLEASLQEEMARHAPLYGAGLEALSMKELETIARIHEEGLRQVHALQQRKGPSPAGSPHGHSLYAAGAPSPMAVGLPQNGMGVHGNGHANGAIGPWFNHS